MTEMVGCGNRKSNSKRADPAKGSALIFENKKLYRTAINKKYENKADIVCFGAMVFLFLLFYVLSFLQVKAITGSFAPVFHPLLKVESLSCLTLVFPQFVIDLYHPLPISFMAFSPHGTSFAVTGFI
jgi:hypothetical protein